MISCCKRRRATGAFFTIAAAISTLAGQRAVAFDVLDDGHGEIVALAVEDERYTEHRLRFSDQALKNILIENALSDARQFDEWQHFDDEAFAAGANAIERRRRWALEAARQGDAAEAHQWLGQALHALQDFYSHSNWVDTPHDTPAPHGTAAEFMAAVRPDPGRAASCSDGSETPEAGNPNITSGYAYVLQVTPPLVVDGVQKCVHGGLANPGWPGDGLNKDKTDRGELHRRAFDAAVSATQTFIREMIAELEAADQIAAICTLLDAPRSPPCDIPFEVTFVNTLRGQVPVPGSTMESSEGEQEGKLMISDATTGALDWSGSVYATFTGERSPSVVRLSIEAEAIGEITGKSNPDPGATYVTQPITLLGTHGAFIDVREPLCAEVNMTADVSADPLSLTHFQATLFSKEVTASVGEPQPPAYVDAVAHRETLQPGRYSLALALDGFTRAAFKDGSLGVASHSANLWLSAHFSRGACPN